VSTGFLAALSSIHYHSVSNRRKMIDFFGAPWNFAAFVKINAIRAREKFHARGN